MNRKSAQKLFIKLGDYVVNLDSISYVRFSEYNGVIDEAVIYLRVTEGTIETSDVSYLEADKLKFKDREAQLIYKFFSDTEQAYTLF
jgi:hypothetical protein